MKIEMEDDGFLLITPENGAEKIALDFWQNHLDKPFRIHPRITSGMCTSGALAWSVDEWDEDLSGGNED